MPVEADYAILTKNLTRKFGDFIAVNEVNFNLRYGEIFGYLGANGAGKSTTIRMLTGILAPSSGEATVAGMDINTDAERIKESIGYVSQKFSLYTDLSVEQNLLFFGEIYGLPRKKLKDRINEVCELTGLGPSRQKIAGVLSGGWKQRLAVANSLLHEPKILFLDEPTAGIDPISRRSLWEMLYELSGQGVALFVTTHYMEEAERCNQIAFISAGKVRKIGTPAALKSELSGKLLQVECRPLLKASKIFHTVPGVQEITAYGTVLHLNTETGLEMEKKLREVAAKNGIEITNIRPIQASLEDVLASLTDYADATN